MEQIDVRDCPKCKSGMTHVIDSRLTKYGWIRRRRICLECDNRWTSYEVPSYLAKKLAMDLPETECDDNA